MYILVFCLGSLMLQMFLSPCYSCCLNLWSSLTESSNAWIHLWASEKGMIWVLFLQIWFHSWHAFRTTKSFISLSEVSYIDHSCPYVQYVHGFWIVTGEITAGAKQSVGKEGNRRLTVIQFVVYSCWIKFFFIILYLFFQNSSRKMRISWQSGRISWSNPV